MCTKPACSSEPVSADVAARQLDEIFEHERYYFCAADNTYVPRPDDHRWCELWGTAPDKSRCPGYARVCGQLIESSPCSARWLKLCRGSPFPLQRCPTPGRF